MGRITIRKIGDIVECKGQLGTIAHEGEKGIVLMELVEDPPPDYEVYWYNTRQTESVYREDLRQCKGMRSKKVCSACEHSLICSHLPEIVNCQISEFGQWMFKGKYNPDVCKQRQCKHLVVCLTTRFIQKED
jgi:hypothetical protein